MKLDVLHQVVGKTRTGKLVVCALSHSHIPVVLKYIENIRYSADDLLDAHAIFEYFYGENTSTTSFQPPR